MVKRMSAFSTPPRRFTLRSICGGKVIGAGLGLLASVSLSGTALAEEAGGTKAAEEPKPAAGETATAAAEESALSPEEQKVHELFQKVSDLFTKRRINEAAALLDEVEKIAPGMKETASIRAAIYSETGEFDKARAIYQKELEENPDAFVPNFNLVELLCMQKKYSEARAGFEKLLLKFPENDFLQFKVLLTHLAEGNLTEANVWAQKLQRSVQTPVMIYAAAAIALRSGDLEMGRKLLLLAENQFGAGNQFLLYQSLAGINLVLWTDYPPKPPAGGKM